MSDDKTKSDGERKRQAEPVERASKLKDRSRVSHHATSEISPIAPEQLPLGHDTHVREERCVYDEAS
jgi:hypothetical protein